MFVDVIKVFIS